MRIEIEVPGPARTSRERRVRAILFNDGFEPVTVSRNSFIGPNVHMRKTSDGPEMLDSVEATFGTPEDLLTLQPFTFYGRERDFTGLAAGEVEITAYYQGDGDQEQISATRRVTWSVPDESGDVSLFTYRPLATGGAV